MISPAKEDRVGFAVNSEMRDEREAVGSAVNSEFEVSIAELAPLIKEDRASVD